MYDIINVVEIIYTPATYVVTHISVKFFKVKLGQGHTEDVQRTFQMHLL